MMPTATPKPLTDTPVVCASRHARAALNAALRNVMRAGWGSAVDVDDQGVPCPSCGVLSGEPCK